MGSRQPLPGRRVPRDIPAGNHLPVILAPTPQQETNRRGLIETWVRWVRTVRTARSRNGPSDLTRRSAWGRVCSTCWLRAPIRWRTRHCWRSSPRARSTWMARLPSSQHHRQARGLTTSRQRRHTKHPRLLRKWPPALTGSRNTPNPCQSRPASPVNLRCISTATTTTLL
jgi:hypothetical protein